MRWPLVLGTQTAKGKETTQATFPAIISQEAGKLILLEQCVSIAARTVLHMAGVEDDRINQLEREIVIKAKEFQRITTQTVHHVEIQDVTLSEILTKTELYMLNSFAKSKSHDVRDLVRHCIMFYCPIEMMIEQLPYEKEGTGL